MSNPDTEKRSGEEVKDTSKVSAIDYSYMSSDYASSEVMPDSLKNFHDIQRLAHVSKTVRKGVAEEIKRPEQKSTRKNYPKR